MPLPHSLHRRSWFRAVVWLVAGLLVLLGIAWLGVPALARWQIEGRGSEQLGRAVTVERVGFNPWKLRTTVEGLQVAGRAGAQAPLLRIDRVRFSTALSSLWVGAPVVQELEVESPHLRVARLAEGRYDFDDLIQRLSRSDDPKRPPARYVLRNLRLSDGTIDFDDSAIAGPDARHAVRDLQLALPEISSLSADRQGEVAPTLAFTLDGSRFDTRLQALPFAELRKGEAELQLDGLELARLRGYWPASLPLRPHSGTLQARLKFAFAQNARPDASLLDISGTLQVKGLALRASDGREAVTAESVDLRIAQLAPLRRSVRLERLDVLRPRLDLRRDKAGRLALLPAAPASAPATPPAAPWTVTLGNLSLRQGQVGWRDAGTSPATQMALGALELEVADIAWPMTAPARVTGSAQLAGDTGPARARLEWAGTAAADRGSLHIKSSGLPLEWARPYLQARLRPALRGRLAADATVAWTPAGVRVEDAQLTLDDLALVQDGKTLAGASRLAVSGLSLDTAQRSVSAARLALDAPAGTLSRDARGGWMFDAWLPAAPASAPAAAAQAAPWKIALKTLQVERGRLDWRDAKSARPVALDLSGVRLSAGDLAWPLPAGRALALQLEAAVAAGQANAGSLRFRGTVQPSPLALDGRLDATRLPLQAVEPYFGDLLNVQLVRADLSFGGTLKLALPPAGLQLEAVGQASVENGRVDSPTPETPAASAPATARAGAAQRAVGVLTPGVRRTNSLMSWRTLQFRNATLRLAPGKPAFWGVHETTLGDFFARLAINETGRLNLRELSRTPADPAVKAATARTTPPKPSDPPELHFGEIHFANGRVQFTDNFVKPSYSASLSELEGVLGAFDSVGAVYSEPAMATLQLRGKAEGSAALDISGKLNPLANPLAIDIVAKVDDLDLPALSPYSMKYMGHGIQRGKLSVNVHYRIEPDGKLTADNSLVLRQLVFDEEADGAKGSLPVRLAAALLADRNGVIDLNLPISGSLNDPQFSLAPVIGRALVNLVTRALTSPFSLISNLFSGPTAAAERSVVAFAPGSAELALAEQQSLDGVASALLAKPALQLTVAGSASEDSEADAMRRERLRQLTRFEKRRALLAASPTVAAPPAAQIQVGAAEYPALLKRVYAATDMPKPRNFVGIARDVPLDEMERLLSAQVDITPEAVRALALQRSAAVRDYLTGKGVPAARVFLGAVRLDDTAAPDWKPAAQLRLSAR